MDDSFYLRVFVLACKLYELRNQKVHRTRDLVKTTLAEFDLKFDEPLSAGVQKHF